MQSVLIISVFALATAVSPQNNWPLGGPNDFTNFFPQGNRPARQGQAFPGSANGYQTNNVNALGNNAYATLNGVNPQQNQLPNSPVNNIQYQIIIPPNNGYPFLQQPAKTQNDPDFQRALNNFVKIQNNNLDGELKKPYVQQKPIQPRLIQPVGSIDRKVPRSSPGYIQTLPPQNQYISYPPPGSAPQLNGQKLVQQPYQAAPLKQAYPQVNSPNTALPLIELDFNPKDPFSAKQNIKSIQQNQIPRSTNGQTHGIGTVHPVINFDINFNTPFPQNNPAVRPITNQQYAQVPQIQLPSPKVNPKHIQSRELFPNLPNLPTVQFDPNSPINTNRYRDDNTHEPFVDKDPFFDPQPLPKYERLAHEQAPPSDHEDPPEVPTKPIYPGEGKWAKFGVKHRPHISPHPQQYLPLEESKGTPDGYETFLEGQKLFDYQNQLFGKKIQEQFPLKSNLENDVSDNPPSPRYERQKAQSASEEEREEEEEEDEEEERGDGEFVPQRLYAQVRQTEEEKHLPPAADENGRLKELLKDSKVHTIYSEEGYEDLAYDHARHEKNAENAEGQEKEKQELVDSKTKTKSENLPPPKIESHGKEESLKEEDIQKLKEEALSFDDEDDEDEADDRDSDTQATEYDKTIISKVKPPKKVYSARTKDASKYKVRMDDFMEGKHSNPISTIVKGDGNTEIEISSEVKVIVQPNNSTKSHKFVKIYPKFRKIVNGEDNIKEEKHDTTEIPFTTISPTIEEIFTVEIPATTQATTAIPKVKYDSSREIITRRKREAEETGEAEEAEEAEEIDPDFIEKINHTLPEYNKTAIINTKFPFYFNFKKVGVDESSALRYSETPKNIPIKTNDGNLAFYSQADQKKECAEVNPIVDPVPDRIKNADRKPEESETGDTAELAKSPRLGELGDKIDCFKAKYFGENPFDNPLFEEKTVGKVQPIFGEIEGITKKQIPIKDKDPNKKTSLPIKKKYKSPKRDLREKKDSPQSESVNDDDKVERDDEEKFEEWDDHVGSNSDDSDNKEDNDIIKQDKPTKEIEHNYITEDGKNPKDDAENVDVNNIINESQKEVNTLPPATLITTPKYTINLTPKHIYDQIELLQYLPVEEEESKLEKPVSTKEPKTVPNKKRKLDKSKSRIKEKKLYLERNTERGTEEPDIDQPKGDKEQPNDKTKIFERYSLFDEDTDKPEDAKARNSINIDKIKDSQNLEKLSEKGTEITYTYGSEEDTRSRGKIRKKVKNNLNGAPTRAKAKGLYEKRRGKVLTETITNVEGSTEANDFLPQPEPLKRHRRLRKRSRFPFIFDINPYIPKIPVAKPPFVDIILTPRPAYLKVDIPDIPDASVFEIFDINQYLPKNENTGSESKASSKYKGMSEVFYKDDIKPDEQLNVFTDVYNNIKNSPYQEDMYDAASQQVAVRVKPDAAQIEDSIKSTTTAPVRYDNRYKNHRVSNSKPGAQDEVTSNKKTKIRHRDTSTDLPETQYNVHRNHKTHDPRIPLQGDTGRIKSQYETSQSKRNEKIQTTTVKPLPEPSPVTEEETEEESTDVMGLVPPDPHRYKTIYNPKRDSDSDTANEGIVEEKKINRFLVPGMKPPPKQKVYNYSDYLTANHIRQKTNKHRRSKRNAARPAYAEVTRNKGLQETVEKNVTKTDEDDYVPHRPRNYHYDEETGKIVYDKKPEVQEESEEEVEYIEVTEATPSSTTGKPKQNPIFATATPPPEGQSYVDFVKLLKSASNYHEIPDPTTTEKGAEGSTTEAAPSTTVKPVSTTPPEFLSILAKVRNDTSYKVIEDKKKTKTTTTTEPPVEEDSIEDTVDGESQVQTVKNSPGAVGIGIVNNPLLKLFDITDFMPNPKNYLPRTSIDTSKYKSIQRPTVRPTVSSGLNSEEENIKPSKRPLLNSSKAQEAKEATVETVVTPSITATVKNIRRGSFVTAATTLKPTQQSTAPKIVRGVRRRVATARIPTTTPADATVASSELTRNRRTHRRGNSRFKLSTTTAAVTTEKPVTRAADVPKLVYRRSQRDSSTLSSENKEHTVPETQTRGRIQYETTTKASSDQHVTDPETIQVVKKVVDIFKNYDQIKRRGRNFKENEAIASENRLGQSNKNRIVSQNENVEVIKKYDKTKKTDGNYRAEGDDKPQVTIPQPEVEVFKDYDKTKKHGGNYRRENEGQAAEVSEAKVIEGVEKEKSNDLEIFKDYDKTQKHGGNYRSEDEAQQLGEPQFEESRVLTPKGNQIDTNAKDVQIFKEYDKSKKHGGNYKGEEKEKDVEIFNNFDESKHHGGNYKPEDESVIDPEIEESYDNEQKVQKRNNENKDKSLVDVIIKPETFYTDPKLPSVINGLKIIDDLPHDELEEIVSSAEIGVSGDELDIIDELERKDRKNVIRHGDETFTSTQASEEVSTTTKKPLFIKDPSQRLYFYAPLR